MFQFMGILLLFFAFTGVTKSAEILPLPENFLDFASQTKQKCMAETGVPSDILQSILAWDIKDVDGTKQFIYCFFTKGGFINDDAKFKVDDITALVGSNNLKDDFKKGLEICNDINDDDKVNASYKRTECFVKNSPILFALDKL